MSSFRFIADVHLSPKTIAALTDQGYDIIRCTDILPANAPNIEILEFARTEDRIVLTQDLDFSMLVAINNYDQPSLITLRLSSAKPDIVSDRLFEVLPMLEQELQTSVAITIDDDSVGIRKLPIR